MIKNITNSILSFLIPAIFLFPVTIKGWASGVLFLTGIMSIISQITYTGKKFLINDKYLNILFYIFIITFFLPILSVLFCELLNKKINIENYDTPIRYVISILILVYVAKQGENIEKNLKITIALSSFLTLIVLFYFPKEGWALHPGRLSSSFIDPLVFGQICLLIGVASILCIQKEKSILLNSIFFISGIIGIYLSIKSDSRTGWFAIPFVLYFNIFHFFLRKFSFMKSNLFSFLISILIIFSLYNNVGNIKNRINITFYEIKTYKWDGPNLLNGVSERLAFIRMGYYLFELKPISGWVNENYTSFLRNDDIQKFAHPESIEGLRYSGFHNQFVDDAVKYGVFGFFSSLFIFLSPLCFFIYCFYRNYSRNLANIGIAIIFIQFIACLSHHVMSFKSIASFYSMIICILVGLIICNYQRSPINNKEM